MNQFIRIISTFIKIRNFLGKNNLQFNHYKLVRNSIRNKFYIASLLKTTNLQWTQTVNVFNFWVQDEGEMQDKYLLHLPTLNPRRCCHHSHSLIWFWSSSHNCSLCWASALWHQMKVLFKKKNHNVFLISKCTWISGSTHKSKILV